MVTFQGKHVKFLKESMFLFKALKMLSQHFLGPVFDPTASKQVFSFLVFEGVFPDGFLGRQFWCNKVDPKSKLQQDGDSWSLPQLITGSPLSRLPRGGKDEFIQLRNLAPQTRVAILGAVGSGKSSFLAMLLGEMSSWD